MLTIVCIIFIIWITIIITVHLIYYFQFSWHWSINANSLHILPSAVMYDLLLCNRTTWEKPLCGVNFKWNSIPKFQCLETRKKYMRRKLVIRFHIYTQHSQWFTGIQTRRQLEGFFDFFKPKIDALNLMAQLQKIFTCWFNTLAPFKSCRSPLPSPEGKAMRRFFKTVALYSNISTAFTSLWSLEKSQIVHHLSVDKHLGSNIHSLRTSSVSGENPCMSITGHYLALVAMVYTS